MKHFRLSLLFIPFLIACSQTSRGQNSREDGTDGAGAGGSATGGQASGGSATGGQASGGSATGGQASGGQASGGSATGGQATGGQGTGGDSPASSCDPACSVGQICSDGECACAPELTPCSTGCVDTMSTGDHCGGCDIACGVGLLCYQGACSSSCQAGLTQCGNSCVDLDTNRANCGGCDNACGAGQDCVGGTCTDPDPDPTGDCSAVTDSCAFAGGLTHRCLTRFALGVNYAWHDFAADFGGLEAWGASGVSANSATYGAELAEMSNSGAQTVRWWMFPDFRGDGVVFGGGGDPTGITAQAVSDIQMALDLAEAQDVYLVLTIFSFDNFRPDRTETDVFIPGVSPMVRDAGRRMTLIENVVRPVAEAVAASENDHRLLGWDIINEPEWAVAPTGNAPSGNEFTPNDELDPVTLTEMKALINESAAVLAQVTPDAQISVGWAAAKWAWAFSDVTVVDFHQPHIYGWVNEWWPYTSSPSELGYGDKPTVMGEFFLASMPLETSATYSDIVTSWYENGYAGAWAWQYIENAGSLGLVSAFADAHGCSVSY